jgi:chorismate mutase/prephenate dehydratase
LLALLTPLADNGISMNKIESRPSPDRLWDYVFFVDIDGHQEDDKVARALEDLQQQAALFKILGSYPKVGL